MVHSDGLQRSTRYPGGVALRFARVLRYRDDKPAAEADTIEAVRALALPHAQSRVAAWVTVSIGVAVRTPNGTGDPNALVAEADEALYRAKQQGRDRVCLFS